MILRIKKRILVLLVVFLSFLSMLSYVVLSVQNCWTYTDKTNCNINSKCTWRDDAWGKGWCEQLDCWSFYTKKDCSTSNSTYNLSCQWKQPQQPPGWCTEANCWDFSGTNQTACENSTKTFGIDCLWGPTDPSPNYIGFNCFGGPQCYGTNISYNAALCKNVTGCSWGSCYEKGCWDYSSAGNCNSDPDCYWTSYNYCDKIGCWDSKHNSRASCDNTSDTLTCRWSQWNYCEALNCWSFNYNQSGCENPGVPNLQCNWNNPWCETKSCWQNQDETSCGGKSGYDAKNCTWKAQTATTGWCEKIACWNLGNESNTSVSQTQCENNPYGLSCTYESNAWGTFCYENLSVSTISCLNISDENKCFNTAWCFWDPVAKTCNDPYSGFEGGAIGGNFLSPGCWIFDLNRSSCTNTTGCTYDTTHKLCNVSITAEVAAGIQTTGLNCTLLNNSDICNGATFLPHCCEWQGSNCKENKLSTKCWDNIKKPPEGASFCEDSNAYDTEATCNQIANNPWYMPCRWNNASKHCEFSGNKVFLEGEEGDIDLIDNKDLCEKGVGGLWLSESYCGTGNLTNASITVGRCTPKLGAQGGNCDTACFRCEFKSDGSNYTSEAGARSACDSSGLGFCGWRSDSKAPNGLGYCEPSKDFKLGSAVKCDSNNCDACNSYNPTNAKTKCQDAKCEWKVDLLDSTKGFCAASGETTCIDRCEDCTEQKTCVEKGRGVNGSCTWDNNLGFCKKTSTAENTGAGEICFDGSDNDADGKVDCADGTCYADPFCGGSFIKDCWQYSNNATCVTNGCKWFNDTYGSWCDQLGAVCWQYDGDQTNCALQNASCEWHASGSTNCNLNSSVWDECAPLNQANCNSNNRCYWFIDPYMSSIGGSSGWCGHRHELCHFNQTLSSNQTACMLANETIGGNLSCSWRFDQWSPNGGYCESSCFNLGSSCNTNSMCQSQTGWCDPAGFGGNGTQVFNCFQFENQPACTNQSNCKWFADPKPMCDVSKSTDCFKFTTKFGCNGNLNCSWTNEDSGGFGGWCDQKMNRCKFNISLSTSQSECELDPLCFWKSWGGGYNSCEPKVINYTTESQCTSSNGTWRSGWCESAATTQMFTGMDMDSPPTPLGNDMCPETGVPAFSDICFFGMKDSKDNFGMGTGVTSIRDAAMCNGITTFQGIGSGNNTAKFYWYIDSDGKSSTGCALNSNSSSNGWDLYFRYEASLSNGSVKELKKSHRCISNEWKATDIQASAWRQKMCNEIQGGMISIKKGDLTAISGLLNLSANLRFYAATANETTNESNPSDTVGPSFFTPGSIDFIPECCWGIGDSKIDCDGDGLSPSNDPDCSFMMYKGFVPFEDCFGNSIDEDADTFVDCNDPDCKGNQYCVENQLGVESSTYVDTTAPKIVYMNVERYPDAALLSFDTDEPANGSVDFYYNSSSCVALNKTLYDVGIWNNKTQKFKNWHDVDIYNDSGINSINYSLSGNKTYFYKFKVCDNTGNCAQSACSNFTTAISAAKCKKCSFIFDMDLPQGWLLDIDLNNDNIYETALRRQCGSSAGISINYTTARSVNLRLRDNSSNTTIFFLDAKLTRSLSHNEKIRDIDDVGGIKNGTTSTTSGTTVGYTGLSKDMSNKLVDKLHPKSCMIQIDKGSGACTTLYHCDDSLGKCVRKDTQPGVSLNESGSNYCIWKTPCAFSTYVGGVPGSSSSSSSSTSSSSGGGGGGGGGGGDAQTNSNIQSTASKLWFSVKADETIVMSIAKEKIALTEVKVKVKNSLQKVELAVNSLVSNPSTISIDATVHEFLEIKTTNIAENDLSEVMITFKVPKSWLYSNSIGSEKVLLYRFSNSVWQGLSTTKLSEDANNVYYQSISPGLSLYAIGAKAEKSLEQEPTQPLPITGEVIPPEETEGQQAELQQEPEETQIQKSSIQNVVIISAIIALTLMGGIIIFRRIRHSHVD